MNHASDREEWMKLDWVVKAKMVLYGKRNKNS